MSAFHGPQRKGAMAERRKVKEVAARIRNSMTLPGNRRTAREGTVEQRGARAS